MNPRSRWAQGGLIPVGKGAHHLYDEIYYLKSVTVYRTILNLFMPTTLLIATVSIKEDYFCLDGEESHSNMFCRTYSGIGPNDVTHSFDGYRTCPRSG